MYLDNYGENVVSAVEKRKHGDSDLSVFGFVHRWPNKAATLMHLRRSGMKRVRVPAARSFSSSCRAATDDITL